MTQRAGLHRHSERRADESGPTAAPLRMIGADRTGAGGYARLRRQRYREDATHKAPARTIVGSAQDCSFSNWRLIKSSACSASLLASGLNLMAAPLFGTIMRSNHTIRKRFTEM